MSTALLLTVAENGEQSDCETQGGWLGKRAATVNSYAAVKQKCAGTLPVDLERELEKVL